MPPVRRLTAILAADLARYSRLIGADEERTHASARGYLVNEEERKGRSARLTLGDPLPAEVEVLPRPELFTADPCSGTAFLEGQAPGEEPSCGAPSAESGTFPIAGE